MTQHSYQRLSAQDNTFLILETPNVHMHVSATVVLKSGPLETSEGGIDVGRIRRLIESQLHLIPRYRQKLATIPFENHAVWVDDDHFDLDYHIRHTSLPRPGNDAQLRRLAARIMGQQLDRSRPLWETWVVEGLEGGRFAMINKMHHCMIDGSSGVDLAHILMSTSPDMKVEEPKPFTPQRAPSRLELWRDDVLRRVGAPFEIARSLRAFRRETADLAGEIATRASAVGELLGWAIRPSSDTPINGPIGPHRSFDWLTMPLADVKAVRRALDCSVNDVVLTTVTGAIRTLLQRRGVDPARIDFRVSAPVSVRREDERGKLGNRVSSWIIRLPIDREDPRAQLEAIHKVTRELKESKQAVGVEMMMAMAEWTPTRLMMLGAQAASGPINSIVTNVPGPQLPLYLCGSEVLEMYPQVPLLENLGLGIALVSYNGKVCWGFNADPGLVPDLGEFKADVERAFGKLTAAARVEPITEGRKPKRRDERTSAAEARAGGIRTRASNQPMAAGPA